MQETPVQFLCQENPLEKKMATHSSILAWEIPWAEEPGGLQRKGVGEDLLTKQLLDTQTVWNCKRLSFGTLPLGIFLLWTNCLF